MYFKWNTETEVAGISQDKKEMPHSIQKAHKLVGHSNEEATRKTAKALGWTIT